MTIRPLVVGNWKMNGLIASVRELQALAAGLSQPLQDAVDVMVCPPATLVHIFSHAARDDAIVIGAQDCHAKQSGAHTGDISAEMLADCGARAVIVGHSERRAGYGETDHAVLEKARAAHRAGLTAIICVGETRSEREAGETLAVVRTQLIGSTPDDATSKNVVIAYEPVWAIGSGQVPSDDDISDVHGMIREQLFDRFGLDGHAIRILYGGSVNGDNAAGLRSLDNVDGALVGGASLTADGLVSILAAYTP